MMRYDWILKIDDDKTSNKNDQKKEKERLQRDAKKLCDPYIQWD